LLKDDCIIVLYIISLGWWVWLPFVVVGGCIVVLMLLLGVLLIVVIPPTGMALWHDCNIDLALCQALKVLYYVLLFMMDIAIGVTINIYV